MAVQHKIAGVTFTDPRELPALRRDSILPAAGALALFDPTHPAKPWEPGVPAHNAKVPNLAWDQAAAVLGAGTEQTLQGDIYSVGLAGTDGLVERTVKGGLHGIISPTAKNPTTDPKVGLVVGIPAAVYDYTRANVNHDYYVSIWFRTTREPSDRTNSKVFASIMVQTQYLAAFGYGGGNEGTFRGTLIGQTAPTFASGAPRFTNLSSQPNAAYADEKFSYSVDPGQRSLFVVGNRNFNNQATVCRGKAGSYILYRAYLEDLTVSGRAHAEVSAIDQALFARACTQAGGRYYGDTFTDPATIP